MSKVFGWIDSLVNKIAKNYTLWIGALLVALVLFGVRAYSTVFPPLLVPPVYTNYVVLQPEWTSERRERYYQTSQGSLVVPYIWYRSLELRTGKELFASPEVQVRYGLLPDNDPKYNPDRLPVGIMKDIVPDEYVNTLGGGHKEWASLSCAGCHTGQILYKGTALRIDGGQSFWRFEQWSADLVFSLMVTTTIPSKYDRFCARVNGHGENGKCSDSEKKALHAQMKRYFDSDLIAGAVNALINHTYVNKEGFQRTDALGRGVNGVFGPLSPKNINRSSGPVSYPPLWYTHEYDWVQSPAAIRQPLARNLTEAWGVNVKVELKDPATRFATTGRLDNLFWLEVLLSTLQAPKWPEKILGRIDPERSERGRQLYEEKVWDRALPADQAELQADLKGFILGPNPNRSTKGYCARCHSPVLEVKPTRYGRRYIQLPLYRMDVMGTDPDDATQFRARQVTTGILASMTGNEPIVGIGVALTFSVGHVLDKWFQEHKVSDTCRAIMEGYRENLYRAPPAYPARPLDGYWATAPYLHNGSVRTMYQLLSPVQERSKTFWIGTWDFDPVHIGYENEPVQGAFLYDTSLAGNSNSGHEFRDAAPNTPGVIGPALSREERLDIIEYLKVLDSVKYSQDQLKERSAILDAMGPFYENASSSVLHGNAPKERGWSTADLCSKVVNAVTTKDTATPTLK